MMEYSQKLTRNLKELKRLTGLSLEVQAQTGEEMEQAAEQIRLLCSAYKNKYDQEYFFQELIAGNIPPGKIQSQAEQLHIRVEKGMVFYLIETSTSVDRLVTEILRNLFPNEEEKRTYIVPIGQYQLFVLRPEEKGREGEDSRQTAGEILNTLNTEALVSVNISYSPTVSSLEEIPSAFTDCSLALEIGRIFSSSQKIYPCGKLGIGQLIYQLPRTLCTKFLEEVFGKNPLPHTLDSDLLHSADTFLNNNLNIAMTARQLHMHRNTLIYRLEQIQKYTGLDLRVFEDAMIFKIASMVIDYLRAERGKQDE